MSTTSAPSVSRLGAECGSPNVWASMGCGRPTAKATERHLKCTCTKGKTSPRRQSSRHHQNRRTRVMMWEGRPGRIATQRLRSQAYYYGSMGERDPGRPWKRWKEWYSLAAKGTLPHPCYQRGRNVAVCEHGVCLRCCWLPYQSQTYTTKLQRCHIRLAEACGPCSSSGTAVRLQCCAKHMSRDVALCYMILLPL
jgi:hypothetical protein